MKRTGRSILAMAIGLAATIAFGTPATAQSLDHYTLIMAWLPGQCLVKPDLPLCADLTLKDPAGRNLTLIGLRPDPRANSVPMRDCDPMTGAFSTPIFEGEVDTLATKSCHLPPVNLSEELARALAEVMPTVAQCAERRFWASYGSCSMLSHERYFDRAVARALEVRQSGLNLAIAGGIGSRVKLDTLVNAFMSQYGEASAASLQVVCGRSKKRNQSVLTEIRIKLRQQGTMRPLGPESFWQETGTTLRHRCPEQFLIAEAGQPVPDPIAKPSAPGTIDLPQMPDIPEPEAPVIEAPVIGVPTITSPAAPAPVTPAPATTPPPDPTKPQPMDTEPMQIIPPIQ